MASDMESSPNTSDDERGRGKSAEPNKKSSEKRKRSRNWTDDETRILISVVRDHYPDLRKGDILFYFLQALSFDLISWAMILNRQLFLTFQLRGTSMFTFVCIKKRSN